MKINIEYTYKRSFIKMQVELSNVDLYKTTHNDISDVEL